MTTLFLFPLMCAICAYAIAKILITSGMILEPVHAFLIKKKVPDWILSPLLQCAYCVAGQWALWGYLYLHWHSYNPFHHIFVVLAAVFCVEVIMWLLGLSFSIEIHNKINKCNHANKDSSGN